MNKASEALNAAKEDLWKQEVVLKDVRERFSKLRTELKIDLNDYKPGQKQ